jgi:hypothetical protein
VNVRPSRSLRFLLSMHITVKHNVTNMKSGKSCTHPHYLFQRGTQKSNTGRTKQQKPPCNACCDDHS